MNTELREVVRDILEKQHDPWPRLRDEVGVTGLAIAEEHGGAGATLAETCVVMEELGRTLTPAPLLATMIAAAASDLPYVQAAVAAGHIATLAWTGADGAWDPSTVACTADDDLLTGTAHYVLDGDSADILLVAAHAGDKIALFEVDPAHPGVRREPVPAMDQTRELSVVTLDLAPGRYLGPALLPRVREVAHALLASEQIGAAARALELTVAYVKERVQFGRPIGSFQALQHRLADLHVLAESGQSIAHAAASENLELATTAKIYCSEVLEKVAAEMIQMHGGIGITWEHDAHRYFKRAHGSAHLFGHPNALRTTLPWR